MFFWPCFNLMLKTGTINELGQLEGLHFLFWDSRVTACGGNRRVHCTHSHTYAHLVKNLLAINTHTVLFDGLWKKVREKSGRTGLHKNGIAGRQPYRNTMQDESASVCARLNLYACIKRRSTRTGLASVLVKIWMLLLWKAAQRIFLKLVSAFCFSSFRLFPFSANCDNFEAHFLPDDDDESW